MGVTVNPNAVFSALRAKLTGLSTAVATAVTESDSILQAIGKLQGQISSVVRHQKIGMYTSGEYYHQLHNSASARASASWATDRLYLMPYNVQQQQSFNEIACKVNTVGAGTFIEMAVYSADASKNPSALIATTGKISVTATGKISAAINVNLSGLIWVAFLMTGNNSSVDYFQGQYQLNIGGSTDVTLDAPSVFYGSAITSMPSTVDLESVIKRSFAAPTIWLKAA